MHWWAQFVAVVVVLVSAAAASAILSAAAVGQGLNWPVGQGLNWQCWQLLSSSAAAAAAARLASSSVSPVLTGSLISPVGSGVDPLVAWPAASSVLVVAVVTD